MNLTSEGTAVFSRYAGTEVPELGPVDIQASVSSTEDSYELQDLVATVGTEELNVAMKATIADLIALKGLNATIDTSISSLSSLSDITKSALPETQPIVMQADISTPAEGDTDQVKLDLNVESGNTTAKLNGLMPSFTSLDDLTITLALDTDSLQDFNQFAQKELPDRGPFSLSGGTGRSPRNLFAG